jgi:hypothetical protein
LTTTTGQTAATTPTIWARLPTDRQRQLRDLLGQLLARTLAATQGEEADHE